jgi:hypothetical protein
MKNVQVRGHHKTVNGEKIWVEEYFRNGVQVSDEEAAVIRQQRKALQGAGVNMALASTADPTLGGHDSHWTPEVKHGTVAELQAGLNPAALNAHDRQMVEHHIEEFLQNADPATDDAMFEQLHGVVEEVSRRAVAGRIQAEDMLGQLGRPVTEHGRAARQLLAGVAEGQGPLDPTAVAHFEDAMHYERVARQSGEVARDILPHTSRGAATADQLARHIRNLHNGPALEEIPRIARGFEELSHEARGVISRVQNDPALARQMEGNAHNLHRVLIRSEDVLHQMRRSASNSGRVDPHAVDALMKDTRIIQQELEALGSAARRVVSDQE